MAASRDGKSGVPYNWHPAVHDRRFGETLHFVMIRLKEPLHRPVADQVRDLLEAADVQHACSYPLFGWWDALLRVWLAPPAQRRLYSAIENKRTHNVADVRDFTASGVRYLWQDSKKDMLSPEKKIGTAIASHTNDIETLAQAPDEPNSKAFAELKKVGLVFERPTTPKGGVKFYTALERTADDHSVQGEIEAILQAMNETVLGSTGVRMTKRSTLYCGAGSLAAYLVRCVADSYDDVLALAESFDKHLKATRLRPMTLLVANPSAAFESDHVNNVFHLSLDDSNAAELLGFSSPRPIAKLQAEDRQQLAALVLDAFETSAEDEQLREMLVAILKATAENDRPGFQASLSFLLDFEPIFKRRLAKEFGEVYGRQWFRHLLKEFKGDPKAKWRKHAEKMGEGLDVWTLAVYILTALRTAELDRAFKGRMKSQLGGNWKRESEALIELRNDLAHGRVHELGRLDVYDRDLVDFLHRAMRAAEFWWRCQGATDDNGKDT